jgi:Resolvase, N terminal domain
MKASPPKSVRCAIYTRVSTEQGLEQDFNSLDAQHDASQAYVRSQAHAGWTLLRAKYDDGGFSGGNTDRPALQRLLQDVRAGKIDVIVVYNVDRLTRSLADFAKLVELFDQHTGRAILPTKPPPPFYRFVKAALTISEEIILSSSLAEREKEAAQSVGTTPARLAIPINSPMKTCSSRRRRGGPALMPAACSRLMASRRISPRIRAAGICCFTEARRITLQIELPYGRADVPPKLRFGGSRSCRRQAVSSTCNFWSEVQPD